MPLALRLYVSSKFLQVNGDAVGVNMATVLQAVFLPEKPFESKSFAQFYDVK